MAGNKLTSNETITCNTRHYLERNKKKPCGQCHYAVGQRNYPDEIVKQWLGQQMLKKH